MYQEGKIMQYWRSQLKTFTCMDGCGFSCVVP